MSQPQPLITPKQFLAAAVAEITKQLHAEPLMQIIGHAAHDAQGDPKRMRAAICDVIRSGSHAMGQTTWPTADAVQVRAEVMAMLTAIGALLIFDNTVEIISIHPNAPKHHTPPQSQN